EAETSAFSSGLRWGTMPSEPDLAYVAALDAALLNSRIASGTKIARMMPIQISVYATGWASDQTVGFGPVPVLPKASRADWASAEIGFQFANVCSGPGK